MQPLLNDRVNRRLRIRDLQMVEIIALRGSMARAAQELGLSQPAISKIIAELERDLGVALFERSTRGVVLTESGQVLQRRGRVILDELRYGLEEIENVADPMAGRVRIGVSLAQTMFITEVIERTSRRYPRIEFSVTMIDPVGLVRSLRDRELDFVVCRAQMAAAESDMNVEVLFMDRNEIVVSPDHPLARRRKLGLADLIAERWALSPPDSYLGGLVRKAFAAQSLPMPHAVVTTTSIELRFALMETGTFITLCSGNMLIHPARRGRMKALPVNFNDDAGPMAAVTLRKRQPTTALDLVMVDVRSVAKSIAARE